MVAERNRSATRATKVNRQDAAPEATERPRPAEIADLTSAEGEDEGERSLHIHDDPMRVWRMVDSTPREATKGFDTGKFKGTAIEQILNFRQATQLWGPCGTGWGVTILDDALREIGGETLHTMTVEVWYVDPQTQVRGGVIGQGITRVAYTTSKGSLTVDAEFNKKSMTDAVGNALRLLGFRADVYMGAFDNNKYTGVDRFKASSDKPAETDEAAEDKTGFEQRIKRLEEPDVPENTVRAIDVWAKDKVSDTELRWQRLKRLHPDVFKRFGAAMNTAKRNMTEAKQAA